MILTAIIFPCTVSQLQWKKSKIGDRQGMYYWKAKIRRLAKKKTGDAPPFCEVCTRSNTKIFGGSFGLDPRLLPSCFHIWVPIYLHAIMVEASIQLRLHQACPSFIYIKSLRCFWRDAYARCLPNTVKVMAGDSDHLCWLIDWRSWFLIEIVPPWHG